MTSVAVNPEAGLRSQGRGYFWLGIAVSLLGLVLVPGQFFGLKRLFVPWYAPALATIGALLLLLAVVRRPTIPRVIGLLLLTALAGAEWYILGSLIKLPDYDGPARAGKALPDFRARLANGDDFTDGDLRDGKKHVLAFFRGRW